MARCLPATLVRQSYAAVFESRLTYIRIIWLPFLIFVRGWNGYACVGVVLWLLLFLLVCRFLLVLPAAAMGESMAFAKSSTTFHGSALRFTAAYFLALLVPDVLLAVVGDPAMWLLSGPASGHGLLVIPGMFALGLMITLAFWVVSVGVVSFAYKALVVEHAT